MKAADHAGAGPALPPSTVQALAGVQVTDEGDFPLLDDAGLLAQVSRVAEAAAARVCSASWLETLRARAEEEADPEQRRAARRECKALARARAAAAHAAAVQALRAPVRAAAARACARGHHVTRVAHGILP